MHAQQKYPLTLDFQFFINKSRKECNSFAIKLTNTARDIFVLFSHNFKYASKYHLRATLITPPTS